MASGRVRALIHLIIKRKSELGGGFQKEKFLPEGEVHSSDAKNPFRRDLSHEITLTVALQPIFRF